ncbi:MAG: YciI family protein [Caulobacterales bacterium]|nr:YciI family protein [Caulobacterales bacterium]
MTTDVRFRRCGAAALIAVGAGALLSSASIAQGPPPGLPPAVVERVEQFLNMELYVYETKLAGPVDELMANLQEHLDYQVRLEESGVLFGAGPLAEEGAPPSPPTLGMIIVRAGSFEEARAIADADPMHANGVRTYTLRKWTMNEGSFDLSVTFSGQRAEIE